MQRGTPLTPLRLKPELRERILAEVERQNRTKQGKPYTLSSWIYQAIEERLAKLERARQAGKAKKG